MSFFGAQTGHFCLQSSHLCVKEYFMASQHITYVLPLLPLFIPSSLILLSHSLSLPSSFSLSHSHFSIPTLLTSPLLPSSPPPPPPPPPPSPCPHNKPGSQSSNPTAKGQVLHPTSGHTPHCLHSHPAAEDSGCDGPSTSLQ